MSAFNRVTVLRRAVEVSKRDFTDKQRKNASKTGEAMPDGSFPIGNVEDLHNAIMLLHNAKDPSEAKEHIVRRATALGAESELPAAWGGGKKDKKPVKKDDMQNEPGDSTDLEEEVEKGGPGSGPRKGSGGKHQPDPKRGAARWPPANPNDALPKPEVLQKRVVDIVSTITTIQKDWAEFDANRASGGHSLKQNMKVTANGKPGAVSSMSKGGKGQFVSVEHDDGSTARYHHSQVTATGGYRGLKGAMESNPKLNHEEVMMEKADGIANLFKTLGFIKG